MRLRDKAMAATTALALTVLLGGLAAPAQASARPHFQMPFPCDEEWNGATRKPHPTYLGAGSYALDFNKGSGYDDFGREVVASAAGTVERAWDSTWGQVVINHGGTWKTKYVHLDKSSAKVLKVGDKVAQGDLVGYVGETGAPGAPHLHYEQWGNGAIQHIWFDGARITYGALGVYNGPLYVSKNCGAPVRSAQNIVVGDFDGDGKADLAYGNGSSIMWSKSGSKGWEVLKKTSKLRAADLLVGDFDGDGKADLAHGNGESIMWSKGGKKGWEVLKKTSKLRAADLLVGDFDGDGKADLAHGNGESIMWSKGGKKGWEVLKKTSKLRAADLLVGDFDGDGIDDLAYGNGSSILWSKSGRAAWAQLKKTSRLKAESLLVGDFDGDGKADLAHGNGQSIMWSKGGRRGWEPLKNKSKLRADRLLVADLDGNGRADLVRTTGSSLDWSKNGRQAWAARFSTKVTIS